jgi:hypothetical protein
MAPPLTEVCQPPMQYDNAACTSKAFLASHMWPSHDAWHDMDTVPRDTMTAAFAPGRHRHPRAEALAMQDVASEDGLFVP